MIQLNFSISNPFSDKFYNIVSKSGKLFNHKYWEVECYRSNILVEAGLSITTRSDHAGIRLEFGLLGYTIQAQIYDSRHWNYDLGCYMVYSDGKEQ